MDQLHMAADCIERELNKYKKLHYRFAKHLTRIARTPVFEKMNTTEKNGKVYYSEFWREAGKRKSKYLGGENNPDVKAIKEKYFLRAALKKLETHISNLEKSKNLAEPFDCAEINSELPKVYRLTTEHLKQVEGPTPEEAWYDAAMKEKVQLDSFYGISYENDLTHRAKDGTMVRSKSEVTISNEFADRGKPYIYEMPTHIGPFLMHPDFTFYSNRFGRVFMWEHAGKLGDSDYMASFSERMDRYIRAGYIPCVDIIFTFDTVLGDIDSEMIKAFLDDFE